MAQLKNTNISDTGSLDLPVGTTAQRPGSPQQGMIRYNSTLGETEYYDGILWRSISDSNPEATGGTIVDTEIGGVPYRTHYFTEVGNSTFSVSKGGTVDVLIVGGGGGGGFGHGGGGGAGAVVTGTTIAVPQIYTITVGAGGAGNSADNVMNPGGSSSAFGVTATGGGAGGNEDATSPATKSGGAGANGGGGTYGGNAGGTGTAPTVPTGWTVYAGNNGGAGQPTSVVPYGCGGGGGAAQVGTTANTSFGGGDGGAGIGIDILENYYHFGGGGGGVIYQGNGLAGNGGIGGGGGGAAVVPGTAGQGGGLGLTSGVSGKAGANNAGNFGGAGGTNTGSGGGGGGNENDPGGNAGSGIVVIRYPRNTSTQTSPARTVASTLPNRYQIVQDGLVLNLDAGNLVSYRGTGTTYQDISGRNNNATLVNSPTFVNQFGGYFNFNGSNEYMTLISQNDAQSPMPASYSPMTGAGTNSFSIELFVRTTQSAGSPIYAGPHLIGRDNGDIYANLTVIQGRVTWTFYDGSWKGLQSTTNISNGTWHHIMYVNKSNVGDMYINGTREVTNGESDTVVGNYFSPDFIGRGYTGAQGYFRGDIAVVRFYARSLTETEVKQNFNALRGRYGI
jgi:hypothetical protein